MSFRILESLDFTCGELMNGRNPAEEEIDKFLKASEDLMKLGLSFTHKIDSAFAEFKRNFEQVMRSNFVEKAVREMLADSFVALENEVKPNLESIGQIYTEGGEWYSFYLGRAAGKEILPPPARQYNSLSEKAKAQSGS
jgi:hypothetical protein